MRKILIRVDAKSKIGWGHFYRSLAIAEMLKEEFEISFAMAAPLPKAIETLGAKGFGLIRLPEQAYTQPDEKGDQEVDFDLAGHLELIDFVLLDGYWFGPQYQQALRSYSVKVGMVEDEGEGSYLADLIINHVPGLKVSNYQLDNPKASFALGSDYALLRPAFLKAAKDKRRLQSNKQVLICFGGSDQHDYTGKAFAAIRSLDESLRYLIILGPSYAHREQLEALISGSANVNIQSNLDEHQMVEAMVSSELAIVPASGILYECLAIGIKVVTVQCAENQRHFYSTFSQLPQVRSAENLSKSEIKRAVQDSLNYKGPRTKVVDGKSGIRLSKLIFELL